MQLETVNTLDKCASTVFGS